MLDKATAPAIHSDPATTDQPLSAVSDTPAVDLPDQPAADLVIREHDDRFRAAIEAVQGILWTNNAAGEMTGEQRGWASLTGQSYDEYQGYGWAKAVHPDDAQPTIEAWQVAVQERKPFIFEHRVRVKAGHWALFSIRAVPVLNDDGSIREWVGVHTNITERRQADLALQVSQAKLQAIVSTAPVAIGLFIGRDLIIELPNQTFIDVIGRGPDIAGKPLGEVMPELAHQPFLQILDEVYTSGQLFQAFESRLQITRDGGVIDRYYNITFTPLFNEAGAVYAILDVSVDVTEQVVARQALEVSEQRYRTLSEHLEQEVAERTRELQASIQDLERSNQSLQQFAYIASHDLQEPLRKIQSFSDMLRERYGNSLGDGIEYIDRMQQSAGRMSALIKDLLAYARISTRQEAASPVSLNQVVQTTLLDLELVIDETQALITLAPLPTIQGDASQLGQLFQNLLSNALKFRRKDALGHYIPPQIQLTAQRIPASDLPTTVKPVRQTPTYHRISVSDNGIGFDQRHTDRIFQVFQRLHNRTEFTGTGIGLAICQKVVTNHGGGITAFSQPGQGATFYIYFPE
ncbi:PAS/PAC sensor signal transduction histidine kinase [Fibrella aestuarina BUZ 2]|uniref:histidine kinase n=1 Tax=Fibrella aestuarina BUZ 2 TaxID=1166018 RepID=I0K5L9_9BACT|nr:ATP-binding protein [Fibrella aestuarina]CCG99422.1 PAS/PAC sensor signal transduction histidine kinase [Fibrella aestuarina BUZ 2]